MEKGRVGGLKKKDFSRSNRGVPALKSTRTQNKLGALAHRFFVTLERKQDATQASFEIVRPCSRFSHCFSQFLEQLCAHDGPVTTRSSRQWYVILQVVRTQEHCDPEESRKCVLTYWQDEEDLAQQYDWNTHNAVVKEDDTAGMSMLMSKTSS